MKPLLRSSLALVATIAATTLPTTSAQAGQLCRMEKVQKDGDGVAIVFESDAHINISDSGQRYVWEAGKLRRWPPSQASGESDALRLAVGKVVSFDFGSHHSGCSLAAVLINGTVAVKLQAWANVPNVPPYRAEETRVATD